MKFEFYVMNEDFNKRQVVPFNVFDNIVVSERTEKAIRKYLRSPKKFSYKLYLDNKTIYGFEAFVKELNSIIMCEEWSRCEYEIAVGSIFTTELNDVIREINQKEMPPEEILEFLKKKESRNHHLQKIDCYEQCKNNMEIIAHTVIRQYKEQLKSK